MSEKFLVMRIGHVLMFFLIAVLCGCGNQRFEISGELNGKLYQNDSDSLTRIKSRIIENALKLARAESQSEFDENILLFEKSLDSLVEYSGMEYLPQIKRERILDIHDEVMPKMGELMSLKKKLLAKVNESENPDELGDLALNLDQAQEGMMVWMRQWAANAAPHENGETTNEERMEFLNTEMEKVKKVREDINRSIAEAKEVLKN